MNISLTQLTTGQAWGLLFLAGVFETVWALGLKYTDGFSRPLAVLLVLAAMGVSVWLLSISVRYLPIGTAYAVWTGIGVIGTVIGGIFLFGEPVVMARLISIMLIIAGIVGLRIFHPQV